MSEKEMEWLKKSKGLFIDIKIEYTHFLNVHSHIKLKTIGTLLHWWIQIILSGVGDLTSWILFI